MFQARHVVGESDLINAGAFRRGFNFLELRAVGILSTHECLLLRG